MRTLTITTGVVFVISSVLQGVALNDKHDFAHGILAFLLVEIYRHVTKEKV